MRVWNQKTCSFPCCDDSVHGGTGFSQAEDGWGASWTREADAKLYRSLVPFGVTSSKSDRLCMGLKWLAHGNRLITPSDFRGNAPNQGWKESDFVGPDGDETQSGEDRFSSLIFNNLRVQIF